MHRPPPKALIPSTLQSRPKTLSGFSLLEVLAVIAIVAVLAILTHQGLKAGAAKAMTVKCLANQKQWITALHHYLGDSGGFLPVSSFTSGSSVDATDALYPYLGKASKSEAWRSGLCPTRLLASNGNQKSLWGTYAFNSFVSEMPIALIAKPGSLIYITDGVNGSRWASWSFLTGTADNSFPRGTPRPHSGHVNITYLDGHSESKPVSQISWGDFTRGTPSFFSAYDSRMISSADYDK